MIFLVNWLSCEWKKFSLNNSQSVLARQFFIQPILYKLCNHRLKFDKETVFLGQLPRVMSSILKDICNYIITLAMYSVWKIRNSVIHGEYGPGREAPQGSTLDLFCKSLKFRIRADFSRYHAYQFSDLWAKNEAFCKFDGDSLDFLFWIFFDFTVPGIFFFFCYLIFFFSFVSYVLNWIWNYGIRSLFERGGGFPEGQLLTWLCFWEASFCCM